MRAFVAIEIPEELKAGMAALQGRLRESGVDAAWSRLEGMHLTLKFLGETGAEAVPAILRAVAAAAAETERFRLGVEGVGTFPGPASAHVVWCGLTGDLKALVALQAAVEQAMAGLGFAPEDRPYAPHLTLGRIKRIRRRATWLNALEELRHSRLPGFAVASVSLISSELRAAGAVYRELGRAALR